MSAFEGYLNLKKKKKLGGGWNVFWFCLVGSSLHYYKHSEDDKPKGVYELKGTTIVTAPDQSDKKLNVISITGSPGGDIFVATPDPELQGQWFEKLSASVSQAATPAPSKEKRKADGVVFRAKKNVASKAATSGAGKKAMAKVLPPAVNNMLNTLENVLEKITPERSKNLFNTLIKVMVKANFQFEKKTLSLDDFQPIYRPLRAVFEQLCIIYDKYQAGDKNSVDWNLVMKYFQSIEGVLSKLMRPHMKPANILKLKEFFDFIGSTDFLKPFYESPSVQTELKELINFFREYSAWEEKYENFTPMKVSLGGILIIITDEPQLSDEQILANLLAKK